MTVVDLHVARHALAALPLDRGAGVGVVEFSDSTTQLLVPALNCGSMRSRRRMSSRVSQPLCPRGTVTSSLHGGPNRIRAYPVFGARPLIGSTFSAASAGPDADRLIGVRSLPLLLVPWTLTATTT